ncbi:uncharacterized protein LOC100263360 isoform X1 [Vitis vinifera]|uniref:uncharacterized protein LOC100263360 isoform X1 n=1 Tax=Vitis vinifera TaxID=29760 RepID=UPI002882F3A1|nr:uncharacterized protein LOC100263360 isoform X1 [Vitis vinifera]
MQVTAHYSLPKPLCCSASLSPFFINSKTSLLPSHSLSFIYCKSLSTQLYGLRIKARQRRKVSPVFASTENNAERWLLEPIGDGDTRHIGFKVARPGAYEIASSVVTVGRLPDKADLVIPVATVSGLHARIQKKEGGLLVTDLDSTNGTFIDDKKLSPGVAAPVSPGSCITFGNMTLLLPIYALNFLSFEVNKIERPESESKLRSVMNAFLVLFSWHISSMKEPETSTSTLVINLNL